MDNWHITMTVIRFFLGADWCEPPSSTSNGRESSPAGQDMWDNCEVRPPLEADRCRGWGLCLHSAAARPPSWYSGQCGGWIDTRGIHMLPVRHCHTWGHSKLTWTFFNSKDIILWSQWCKEKWMAPSYIIEGYLYDNSRFLHRCGMLQARKSTPSAVLAQGLHQWS